VDIAMIAGPDDVRPAFRRRTLLTACWLFVGTRATVGVSLLLLPFAFWDFPGWPQLYLSLLVMIAAVFVAFFGVALSPPLRRVRESVLRRHACAKASRRSAPSLRGLLGHADHGRPARSPLRLHVLRNAVPPARRGRGPRGLSRRLLPVTVKATSSPSLLGLVHAPCVWAEPMTIEDLLRNYAQLEGTSVTVLGTLKGVRAHLSKHGERRHCFELNDRGLSITVVARACRTVRSRRASPSPGSSSHRCTWMPCAWCATRSRPEVRPSLLTPRHHRCGSVRIGRLHPGRWPRTLEERQALSPEPGPFEAPMSLNAGEPAYPDSRSIGPRIVTTPTPWATAIRF
jgi:hypothetical protein